MRFRRSLSFFVVVVGLFLMLFLTSCGSPPRQAASPPSGQEVEDQAPARTAEPQPNEPAPKPPESSPAQQPGRQPSAEAVPGKLEAHFIDVGQGDACLIRLPNGETVLVDAGPTAAADRVVAYLKKLGVKNLDYVVFTHPHEDHIGGGSAVLKSFEVGRVFMPRTGHTTRTYENLLLAVKDKGLKITEAKAGVRLVDASNLKVLFVAPRGSGYQNLNDWSAVTRVEYGKVALLLTGDAEARSESEMLTASDTRLKADVLKVAHHGSSSSTSGKFLEAVSPEYAVISVGTGNQYGHPARATLERLAAAGVKVYRTDLNGTVVAASDGKEITVNVEREASTTAVPPPAAVWEGSNGGETVVYVTKTGTKYHREGCRYLGKSKIQIALEEAKARGYEPCSVCKPPK